MRIPMPRIRAVALLALAALWNCSGGGAAQSVPGAQSAVPPPATTKTAVASTARFTITIPLPATVSSTARTPKYVSPATQSIIITLASVNGNPYTASSASIAANLTTSNPACSGTPLTCTVTAPAVVGNDVFTAVAYDAVQTSTSPAAPAGNVLSRAGLSVAVVAGPNTVTTPLVLSGAVASLAIALASVVTPGATGSVGVMVNALDADGNVIVGPGGYVNAGGTAVTLALSNSDGSGNSTLSQSSVTQPTTGILLNYTAAFDANPTIAVAASGLTSASAKVAFPAPTLTNAPSGVAGSSVTDTLTGTNFVAGNTTVSVAASGVTVSSVSVTSSTTLTAAFAIAGGAAFGTQNVTVTTTAGTSNPTLFAVATANTLTVSSCTDTGAGTPAGTGTGNAGDLRAAILNADGTAGDRIVFSCSGTIALGGPLPPLTANMVIDGGSLGSVIIDGGSAFRVFTATSGAVILANLRLQNATAEGGAGGAARSGGSGGGGAGLGAGLLVNGAAVSVLDDDFTAMTAAGGAGGAATGSGNGGGGGGGLGGAGGSVTSASGDGGGGGGGFLSAALAVTGENGSMAGTGFAGGAGGGGQFDGGAGAGATVLGAGGGGGGEGANLAGGAGGTGAFGGGGGGGGQGTSTVATGTGGSGAMGGFGGGGGGGGAATGVGSASGGPGANGGPGGGGGGGGVAVISGAGGSGGTLASVSGGNGGGAPGGGGGGGAAAGPAIFVVSGSVTTQNSGAAMCTATSGAATAGGAAGTADPTPVFNFGGTVNGSALTGPVASALGNAPA
jgi:hypothetical protein